MAPKPGGRYPERRARYVGGGRVMGVRRQEQHLVGSEPQRLQSGKDAGLKFGSHDLESEAENKTSLRGALQQNDGNFDRVEDRRDRSLARGIARQPDRTIPR